MRLLNVLATGLLILALPAGASALDAAALQARASELHLHEERYWHLLLHYRRNLFGYFRSEADGEEFFLSPDGKTDPEAELLATVAALFEPLPENPEIEHPRCQFPERTRWVIEKLGISEAEIPPVSCPVFDSWLARFNPGKASLIFATAYLNNPASLYGHTFLKMTAKGAPESSDVLSYIVNFAATVDTDIGVLYASRGLFGGFDGRFSTVPYYLKIQEYTNVENRDLWEYPLDFNQEQVDRMARHLWELGHTYFDYFFLDENCSYHLLAILEIADPEMDLRGEFPLWAIPMDTLRVATERHVDFEKVRFRPSDFRKLKRLRQELSEEERELVERIAEEHGEERFAGIDELPPERQAFVLDTADLYLRYRAATGSEAGDTGKKSDREILLKRSRIEAKYEPVPAERPPRPDLAHEGQRFSLGGGATRSDSFEELTFRAAFHDFLGPPEGFERGSEIEMLGARLRVANEAEEFTVEHFGLARIFSLWPADPWSFRFSWEASLEGNLPREVGCREMRCFAAGALIGGGLAAGTEFWRSELFYVLAEAQAEGGAGFKDNYRLGPAVRGGAVVELFSWWRVLGEGRYFYPALGDEVDFWEVRAEQSFSLHRNVELRAAGITGTRPDEVSGGFYFYF